ncbi:DivIVA domain-containing protein [Leucobacter sp. GX24907]
MNTNTTAEPKSGEQSGHTAFPLARKKQLGYDPEQVEDFLDRARSTYEGGSLVGSPVSSEEVRRTAFGVKKGGYAARYVDAAMDRLEEVFYERERRTKMRALGEDAWWAETRQLLSEVRGRLQRPRGKRFRVRGIFATGYRKTQVDAFLDRVSAMLENKELPLQPSEVRDVVFHSQLRGYDEEQVDALLDSVVELILATR